MKWPFLSLEHENGHETFSNNNFLIYIKSGKKCFKKMWKSCEKISGQKLRKFSAIFPAIVLRYFWNFSYNIFTVISEIFWTFSMNFFPYFSEIFPKIFPQFYQKQANHPWLENYWFRWIKYTWLGFL